MQYFPLGIVVVTPGAAEVTARSNTNLTALLARHHCGDWGDLCAEDCELNNRAVKDKNRIFSAYNLGADEKVWVITEADRSSTTILLPEEY